MRMLSKFVVAFIMASAASTGYAAEDAGKQRFSHEGFTYVYNVKETANGKVISGRRYPDAVAFNLAVKNGKVSGVSGGKPVNFKVEDARGAASN